MAMKYYANLTVNLCLQRRIGHNRNGRGGHQFDSTAADSSHDVILEGYGSDGYWIYEQQS